MLHEQGLLLHVNIKKQKQKPLNAHSKKATDFTRKVSFRYGVYRTSVECI